MPTKRQRGERTASVTITLPLGLWNEIDVEREIMGRSFSDATAVLVRIGINSRKDARATEPHPQRPIS